MNSIDKPNNPHAAKILGDPRTFVAPVPSSRSTFALDAAPDAVPEHVAATTVQAAILAERSAP
jgi:hypothetical protein